MKEFAECYLKDQVDKNWKDPGNEHRYREKDFIPGFGNRHLKDITINADLQLLPAQKAGGILPANDAVYCCSH